MKFNYAWNLINIFSIYHSLSATIIPPQIFTTTLNEYSQEIRVIFHLTEKDFLYKNLISFAAEHPEVTLSSWTTKNPTFAHYDNIFKETKEILKNTVIISIIVTAKTIITEPVYIHCMYYQRSAHKIQQLTHKIFFTHLTHSHNVQEIPLYKNIKNQHEHIKQFYTISIANFIEIILFIALIFLLLLHIYMYKKKSAHHSNDIFVTIITAYFIVINTGAYYLRTIIHEQLSMFFFIATIGMLGIYYLKKSTDYSIKYLRAFCNICGAFCLVVFVPLLLKMIIIVLF